MRANYLLFNNTQMRYDVGEKALNMKGTSLSRELNLCGCNDSMFPNAYRNYLNNKDAIAKEYDIPTDVPRLGWIHVDAYETVIKHFGLKDKYRIPKRIALNLEKESPEIIEVVKPSVSPDDLKALNNNIIMLTKAIMVLADRMPATINTLVRPKAYLNKEKEDK